MDLNKNLSKKSKRKILAKNDMVVSTDSEDESVISSSTSVTTVTTNAVLHYGSFRLANSMSIDTSDSDSDFVQFPNEIKVKTKTPYKKIVHSPHKELQKAKNKSLSQSTSKKNINANKTKKYISQETRQNAKKNSSSQSSENNLNVKSKEKSENINIISVERVKIPLNSVTQETTQHSDVPRKSHVRNIFPSISSINIKSKSPMTIGTQTGIENQESSTSEESDSDSTDNRNDVEVQTDINKNIPTNGNVISKFNVILKRPYNVATQTDLTSSDEEVADGSIKRKIIEIQVSPPKRLNTIAEECSDNCAILRLIDEHQNKLKAAKINLTKLLHSIPSSSSKTPLKCEVASAKKRSLVAKNKDPTTPLKCEVTSIEKQSLVIKNRSPTTPLKCEVVSAEKRNSVVKNRGLTTSLKCEVASAKKRSLVVKNQDQTTPLKCEVTSTAKQNRGPTTPMKQKSITELNFFTTPNSSPTKSTSSISPVKSTTSTSPEIFDKKKESRYTKQSHNRVFENVKKIANWVFENEHFKILFTKSEVDLLQKLFDLPDQRLTVLCLRLFTRQHKWYNLSNLCEELNLTYEGFNLKEFYSTLTAGFVSSDYSDENNEHLLDYLSLQDIKDICRTFKIRIIGRKGALINKLLEYSNKQCTLTSLKSADQVLRDQVKTKLGICIKLETKVKDTLYRIHLLYSITNPELVTANDIYNLMNKVQDETLKYPKVKIDSPFIFSNRQDFLKYADACVLRKEFYDQISKKDIPTQHLLCVEGFKRLQDLLSNKKQLEFDKTKPLYLRRFSTAWVYCKVLSAGSQHLGKSYSNDVCAWLSQMLNQKIYCIQNRGDWYSQLALITCAHKKDVIGEVQTIEAGLSDEYVKEVQKHELSIRGSKIKKAKVSQLQYDQLQCLLLPEIDVPNSRTIQANVVHNNERGKKLTFVRTTSEGKEYGSVEETAINYYKTQDYTHGIHCEGRLLETLFIILFWDILYDLHIPNTFITKLQNRPLDLYSGEFFSNRKRKIDARLKNIRDDWSIQNICQFASKIYTNHYVQVKSLTNFDFVQEDTIHIIIRCIGLKLLAAILERFAKDFKQFHSGMPDLFLWNSADLTCCFVEVKSENDRLSTKQLLWINYLHKFGAKVEVCHVQHIGSSTSKKMKQKNCK